METAAALRKPLRIRAAREDSFLESLEGEAASLLPEIKRFSLRGPWDPSPLETKFMPLREGLVMTPGVLRGFRHWFLAAGRLNFPDSPYPKSLYLTWNGKVPRRQKWLKGALLLARMASRLYRRHPFRWEELEDNRIGGPSVYHLPGGVHLTEVQLRMLYYRREIEKAAGKSLGAVLEVGGGYGALAAELLRHLSIGRYFLVELPDAIPMAFFYLKACFEGSIQVLYRPGESPDPEARIVILPPWKLPELEEEIDLLINTASFQHMMPEAVSFYLSQAGRLKARTIYLMNRNVKRDPTDLVISEYPIPSGYREVSREATDWFFGSRCLQMVHRREAARRAFSR